MLAMFLPARRGRRGLNYLLRVSTPGTCASTGADLLHRHLFCFSCIMDHLAEHQDCPYCHKLMTVQMLSASTVSSAGCILS